MHHKLIYLAGLFALCALAPQPDDVRVARAAVDAEFARYETVLDQATQRYRAVLVGELETRGGRDVPARTLLRPIERARDRLALQKRAIAGLQERVGSESAPLSVKDFGRTVDERYVQMTKIVWKVLLVEAEKKVVLLQQMYDRETRTLRERLSRGGTGAKAEVKRRETALKTHVLERFNQVATRLAQQRRDFLGWLEQYSDAAKAAGRTDTEAMIKQLLREEFSLSDDTGSPSSFRVRLDFSSLILGSIVEGESRTLKLADALTPVAASPEAPSREISLDFLIKHFDGTPSDDPTVELGGLLVMKANLQPPRDSLEVKVTVERDGGRMSRQTVRLTRVDRAGPRDEYVSKDYRITGDGAPMPDLPELEGDDPAGNNRIEAKVNDRIVIEHGEHRKRILVTDALVHVRYVRKSGDRWVPVDKLLYGVRYKIEVRLPHYQDDLLECKMSWGPDADDREEMAMFGIGGNPRRGYTLFRSLRYFVLENSEDPSAVVPGSTNAGGAQPGPGRDWFLKTWHVTYLDSLYSENHNKPIEGVAFVRKPAEGENGLQVHVVLQDPLGRTRLDRETGRQVPATYRLNATRVVVMPDHVELTFRGQSPSLALTDDGKKDVREWGTDDLMIRRVDPGTVIQTKWRSWKVAFPAQPHARYPMKETDLKLTLTKAGDDRLTGTWSYPYGEQGMYGRRTGRRDPRTDRVQATEDWARATSDSILSVVELRERRTEEAAANERPPSVTTVLKVKGWDLPTTAAELGNTVTFEDPLISFVEFGSARPAESDANRPAELELKVRLQAGVRPGEKSIRLIGLDGSWTLRFRDSRPQVQFRRRTGPRTFTTTPVLLAKDTFTIEARLESDLAFSHRLIELHVGGRQAASVLLEKDTRDPALYTSPPIQLIDPAERSAPENGVAVQPGDRITLYSGDAETPVAWAEIEVLESNAFTQPRVIVHPPGIWVGTASLDSVSLHEPFTVRLRVPGTEGWAAKKVKFQVRGKQGSAEVPVHIIVMGTESDAPVLTFAPRGLITIGGSDAYSVPAQFRLDQLDVKGGDIIEASYGESKTSFTVYETRLKKRLAIRTQQVQKAAESLRSILKLPQLDRPVREIVEIRLHLAQNALALIQSSDFWDMHRISILETYLHMLQEPIELHDPRFRKIHPTYGVTCISQHEWDSLERAVQQARGVLRKMSAGFRDKLWIGLARFTMITTGAEGTVAVCLGYNVYGQRLNFTERMTSLAWGVVGVAVNVAIYKVMRWVSSTTPGAGWRSDMGTIRKSRKSTVEPPRNRKALHQQKQRMDLELKRMGVEQNADDLMRAYPGLSTERALVVAGAQAGVPPHRLMKTLGLDRSQVGRHLDAFYKDAGLRSATRKKLTREYLGDEPAPGGRSPGVRLDEPTAISRPPPVLGEGTLALENQVAVLNRRSAAHRRPGREAVNRFFKAQDDLYDEIRRMNGVPAAQIDAQRARRWEVRNRHHEIIDRVDRITGGRTIDDYDSIEAFMIRGATEKQAIVGHVWNQWDLTGKSPAEIATMRTVHRRIPQVLGMSRQQWVQTLRGYYDVMWPGTKVASRHRAVVRYFKWVDGK